MRWLIDLFGFGKTRRLRKASLDEVLEGLKDQGVDVNDAQVFWKLHSPSRFSKALNGIIEQMIELKRDGTGYSLDFFKRGNVITKVPEGYSRYPIAWISNPEREKYVGLIVELKKEILRENAGNRSIEGFMELSYEEDFYDWKSTSMEEWERRNEERARICPDCRGEGGRMAPIDHPEIFAEEWRNCDICQGGTISAEALKQYNKPKYDSICGCNYKYREESFRRCMKEPYNDEIKKICDEFKRKRAILMSLNGLIDEPFTNQEVYVRLRKIGL